MKIDSSLNCSSILSRLRLSTLCILNNCKKVWQETHAIDIAIFPLILRNSRG